MNKQLTSLLIVLSVGSLAAACSSDSGGSGNSTGGSGNSGGSGGGSSNPNGVALTPDSTGFVQVDSIMLKGAWYAYADSIGSNGMPPGNCQSVGMHSNDQCSNVISPTPGSFPNDGGKMCTKGTVEAVGMLNGSPDYDNQWGAGIGLDFNNPGMGATKAPYDATAQAIRGVSFEIDAPPTGGMRVEFPDEATNGKSAAYWMNSASTSYPPSPVKKGSNTILWENVFPPASTVPALTPSKLMGIQFHVTTGSTTGTYEFCISNLTMIK